MEDLDRQLMEAGANAGKAMELSKARAAAVKNRDELYEEYERLDELVRRAAEAGLA